MTTHKNVENILHYHFRDASLLDEALRAEGVVPSKACPRQHGNKPLALIGDAILRLVIVDDGIVKGASTSSCQHVVASQASNAALQRVFEARHLERDLETTPGLLHPPAPSKGGNGGQKKKNAKGKGKGKVKGAPAMTTMIPRTTSASAVEALVGAVWLDSGRDFGRAHRVVHEVGVGGRVHS